MTSGLETPSSARKLSEVARRLVVPKSATLTGWPDIERTCRKLGATFDRWQSDAGRAMFCKTPDGKYAATVGGVGLSLPRQVGKTHLVGYALFALCVIHPGLTVIWTSQHSRTTNETMLAMQGMAAREKVAPHVRAVTTGNGDECVHFHNHSRILFGAREAGFGRGIPGVDVLVFDEAQNLTDKALDAMLASMNTAPNGLALFMGTPPTPEDAARGWDQVFTRMRNDASTGTADDIVWIECGADPDADPDDRKQWAKANPSYPHRTPATSMLRLKKKLRPDSWLREGLGIWDSGAVRSTVRPSRWNSLSIPVEAAPREGSIALAVKFSADGERFGAGVALRPPGLDSSPHVEALGVSPMSDGTAELVDWIAKRWRNADKIVLDGKAGAGDLLNELVAAGVPRRRIHIVTSDEAITAHAGMLRAINEADQTHIAQPGLDKAVRIAGKRPIGQYGGWGWKALTPDGDVTSFEAVTLARHFVMAGKRRTGTGEGRAVGNRSIGNRAGVVA